MIFNSNILKQKNKYFNQSSYKEKENSQIENNSLSLYKTNSRHHRNKSSLTIKKSSSVSTYSTINKKNLILNKSM